MFRDFREVALGDEEPISPTSVGLTKPLSMERRDWSVLQVLLLQTSRQ